jgi:PKD repeat protein
MRKPFILAIALAALVVLVTPGADSASAQPPDFARAIAVQERHTPALLSTPGIVGTGVGLDAAGNPVIQVYLQNPRVGTPPALENIPVERVVTGQIVARCRQDVCERPVPLGVSTGHPDVTAGTIGARVRDQAGNVYALSNNHVYANSNNASIGDSALQPGTYDGGQDPQHKIGELYDFQEIDFSGGNNVIDAAIVVTTTDDVSNITYSGYTPISTPADPSVGLPVKKDGRTTGLTTANISATNVTVTVCFEQWWIFCTRSATFVNQIGIEGSGFSAGGDSGSLIVTQDGNRPVGLLFAGSSTHTFANPIQPILERFDVVIDDGSDPGPGPEPEPDDPTPPTASFTDSCVELTCDFDASDSTAGDATIVSYEWDFGDGNAGTGVGVSHTYVSDGIYTVTLTVTDAEGESGQASKMVTVSAPQPEPDDPEPEPEPNAIQLDASGYRVRGVHHVDLSWSGANSSSVDVYRNGTFVTTVATSDGEGTYTDNTGGRGGGSYVYRICEASTDTCSNEVTVTF